MAEQYDAKSIKVLEGLEAVRLRPAMYIGSTSKEGLHHCFYEVIDNSIDEVQAGVATLIKVTVNKDGSLTVEDNGRGIPVDRHESGKSALEIVMTKLHAGGKFESKAYQISGGLHGVGVSVVNALSTKLIAQVKRDGKLFEQVYKRGVPQGAVKVIGSSKNDETGTIITFYPDEEIFSTTNFDFSVIINRVRELAFLNPTVKIIVEDERDGKKEEYHYDGGLTEFVKWINRSKSPIHKPIYFKKQDNSTIIEVCVQYVDGYQENIFGFVNTINTVEGGTHVSGFKTALTRAINDYANKKGILKKEKLSGDDVREGLTAIISIRIKDPQFEGQTKTKLGNSEVKGMVDSLASIALTEFFEENPDIANKICNKCVAAAKAREAAKKARDLVRRKSVVGFSGLPGKLADCSSKKFETTELYIVEGDSAGGCFSGDTKIALADGRNVSFKQLVEESNNGNKNFCYTIKKDGNIGIEEIKHPRITKNCTEVIKIILDNDQDIICTPNHKFMLRDGNYKEAKDLTKEDSLMPLYEKEINIIPRNNHKIKSIEKLNQRINVYDIEVPETHNFALASGVFVHNSAKMARDKEFQAILPLKGKPLNVEKAIPVKVLGNEEIVNLITAIGAGIKENFDIKKLRYAKVIIMSVDGEEGTFIQTSFNEVKFVKIGEFINKLIDNNINPSAYKVLCFNLNTRKTQFKSIKAVIRHPIEDKLYEIKTAYGRNVKVTSSHSIFVYENKEVKLKKGNEIKKGDKVVAPSNLPLYNYANLKEIDVLALLLENKNKINCQIYIHGESVKNLIKHKLRENYKDNNELVGERVVIPDEFREFLIQKRKEKKFSQKELCQRLKIKQPCTYYEWEKGKSKPTLANFTNYIEILEVNKNYALSQVQVVESKLDYTWKTQYKNSKRNKLKSYISLNNLEKEDLEFLDRDVKICPTHYNNLGISRFISVSSDFMKLLGFWMAEGSCSQRNGIRLAIGSNNIPLVDELKNSFFSVFKLMPKISFSRRNCHELKLVNRAASLFWQTLFGFKDYSSETKKFPDLIYNISKELQIEFLRMYFLGDGTIGKNGISFTTTSKDMANQLMYLLLAHGVISGLHVREPSSNELIISKNKVYTLNINRKSDLNYLKKVWESHRNSAHLNNKLASLFPSINTKFEVISDDLVALEVKDILEVKPSEGLVYDFSVDEDENFIAGFGGLCCHNTDADVDGHHIRTLLLTFFYRYVPELIENGNIYVAVSPLYRVRWKGKDWYVYSDEELEKDLKKAGGNPEVQRFKGLGEMNPEQLWETTMDPKKRILKKITVEDAVRADEVFTMLMGDAVGPRRRFIELNANIAELDI